MGHNTPDATGDIEPISKVKELSLTCRQPLRIQCQTVGGVDYDQTGQIVTCNLWEGLTCNNMDQFDPTGCLDYRVRLGCLKQTPECGQYKINECDEIRVKLFLSVSVCLCFSLSLSLSLCVFLFN